MKKHINKMIITFIILIIPVIISAKSYDYENSVKLTDSYILQFPEYNDYIKIGNMPYDYENGKNNQSLRFAKGGFLSKDEYQITNVYGSSYLSQGIEYWTLTPHSYERNYTITYNLGDKLLSDTTNTRISEFVKNEAKILGNGTQNDPWYFVEVTSVNVYSSDETRGTLSLDRCEHKNEGSKTIVVHKYGEENAKFYVCEDDMFRYYKTTCSNNIIKESNSNLAYIKGEINDNTICKIEFAHKTHTINLGTCDGCSAPTPNKIYLAYNRTSYFSDNYGQNQINKINVVPKKTGYTFKGYKVDETLIIKDDGTIPNEEAVRNINPPSSDEEVAPIMEANKYSVTFNANGGTNLNFESKTVTYDQKYDDLPSVSRIGYTFAGWYTSASGGNKITSETMVKITSNQILYAHWNANTYTISFNANGGSSLSQSSKTVTYDSTYGALPTVSKTGYTFAGWYTESSGGTKIETSTKVTTASNQTFYAHWTVNNYSVTFNANGGGTPTPTSKVVTYDSVYGTLATISRTGYNLKGWYTASSGGTQITDTSSVKITSNQILYAQWTAKTFTVTFNANGGGSLSQSSKTVTYNSTYGTLPTTTRNGYEFLGWYTASSGGTKISTTTAVSITTNQTLYAQWKQYHTLPIFTYTGKYQLVTDNDTVIASGTNTKVTIPSGYLNYTGNWKIRFLTSGTITFHELRSASNGIDVFLVGGGGNGGGTFAGQAGRHGYSTAGGGGGGGYRKTQKGVSVSTSSSYAISIGAARTKTTGFGYTANPGSNGTTATGFDQEPPGGAGGSAGGAGGCNANDGSAGAAGGCEFNDCTLYSKRYGGGGGGGHAHNGRSSRGLRMPRGVAVPGAGGAGGGGTGNNQYWGANTHNGTANTGGGGGGGSFVFDKYDACGDKALEYYVENKCNCWSVNGCFNVSRTKVYSAGTGGSGIAIIRNKR